MITLTEERKLEIVDAVLAVTPLRIFNAGIRQFSTQTIYRYSKREFMYSLPECNSSELWYSLTMCEAFRAFTSDEIKCSEMRRKIDKLNHDYKLFGKYHPTRHEMIAEHNKLVTEYNALLSPQMELRKRYRKILKSKKVTACENS